MKILNINLDMRYPKRYFFKNPTLNQRLLILRKKIYEHRPDFIFFQEVTDLLILGDLKASMFYPYSFNTKGILKVKGGLATGYNFTKYKFVYKKFFAFKNQGRFFSREIADRLLNKGMLFSVFDNRKTGERYSLINLHFTANYGRKKSDEERDVLKLQLQDLAQLISRKKHIGTLIIAGDFNADFKSKTMQTWLTGGYRALFHLDSPTIVPSANPLCHQDQKTDCQIDNILLTGKYSKVRLQNVFNKPGEFISDHIGQLAEIK